MFPSRTDGRLRGDSGARTDVGCAQRERKIIRTGPVSNVDTRLPWDRGKTQDDYKLHEASFFFFFPFPVTALKVSGYNELVVCPFMMERTDLVQAIGATLDPTSTEPTPHPDVATRNTAGRLKANPPSLGRQHPPPPRWWYPVEFVNEKGEKEIVQDPSIDIDDVPDDAWGRDTVID